MGTWKALLIYWAIVGVYCLIAGVTRLTFLCLWLLYLMELAKNAKDEERDKGHGKTKS